MKLFTLSLYRLFTVLAVLLALGSVTPASAADDYGTLVATIPAPDGVSAGGIKNAIVSTLAGRLWTVTEKSEEKVVGYLKHRSNEATVTFLVKGDSIELYCAGYEINKNTGERKRPEQPTGWLNNLRKDLAKQLVLAK